jgi:hypothetical protein
MELTDLRFWNQAPTIKVLTDNGIVLLTTDKLKKEKILEQTYLKL